MARGLSILASLTFIFAALQFMPLAEATVINFTGPLFMVALAGPMLGEKVGWRRWAAVLVGLAGAMIVVRPGSEVFQWAALLPIGSAVFFALFQLITRKLAGHDSTMTTLLYTQVVAAAGARARVQAAATGLRWRRSWRRRWRRRAGAGGSLPCDSGQREAVEELMKGHRHPKVLHLHRAVALVANPPRDPQAPAPS